MQICPSEVPLDSVSIAASRAICNTKSNKATMYDVRYRRDISNMQGCFRKFRFTDVPSLYEHIDSSLHGDMRTVESRVDAGLVEWLRGSMKIVTYSIDGLASCGVLNDRGVVDIRRNWRGANPPGSVKEILEGGKECLSRVEEMASEATDVLALEKLKLLAPIPRPGKVIALAGNYAEHIKEAGLKLGLSDSPRWTTVPRPFIKPASVVIGTGEEMPWPVYSKTIDYEIELAAVIGRKAKCVSPEQALDVVAGCTIVNDISARTVTFAKNRAKRPWDEFYDWLNGKWADGFLPMGPYLVTADEIEDVQGLEMCLTVNGRVRQKANTSQMIHPVADVVSFVSHLMTLEPGDVIATGTPSGVGLATGNYLKAGDRIEATIENLGTLVNTLGPQPSQYYEPLA
jgi:2-keto-4-pentenoate hydratase/2-oxohepta-3-ene-1,7-dioic acid hydratase in catechol pathway